jgi:hypothetical protein
MIPPFYIFRRDDAKPICIGTAPTLEAAKSQIRSRGANQPGEHMIVSLQTGHKETIKVESGDRRGLSR